MTTPAHPQRCETCEFHTENQYMDFCHGYSMSNEDSTEIILHIQKYGCASHSSVQSRDQVLNEVIALPKTVSILFGEFIRVKDIESLRTQGSRDP